MATRATRSKPEKARRRTTAYPPATKAKALKVLESDGVAAAHKATKVPKPTLTRWAKAAGIDLGEQARARTATASATVRARAAEVRLSAVEQLEAHIDQAGHYLATVVGLTAHAADLLADVDPANLKLEQGIAGPYVVVEDKAAQDAQKRAMALASLPLVPRDAEGILTRAIHDLQLLRGEATERGELVVEFTVPRPTTGTPVVDEDQLGES